MKNLVLCLAVAIVCYLTLVHYGYAAQIINQCDSKTGVCTQIIIPDNPDTAGGDKTQEY